MTREHFDSWCKRLFVAFPSILEKLKHSESPKETRGVWFRALEDATVAEGDWLLSQWESGQLDPPAAYEWDRVHLIAKSNIGLRRDRIAKAAAGRAIVTPYKQIANTPYTNSNMAAAFRALKPLHEKLLAGQTTPGEYQLEESKYLAGV
jgi:hypothetical protein